jgi:tetratricopeptide (TPR) repeat protein
MDFDALLEKTRLLNKANRPRAALNILKHLYKLDVSNLDVIIEVVTSFENLGEWKKARAMLGKGIGLDPENSDLWIRLCSIYKADNDIETALKAINKGLSYKPDNLPLLIQKSHLLANLDRVNQMKRLIDDTITKHPGDKKDLLIERAEIYQLFAQKPDDDEEQVIDSSGTVYSAGLLKKAINDLNDAMDCDEQDYQIPLKLARLYKQLNNVELAIFSYDDALSLLNDESEEFRKSIQQERNDYLNDSGYDSEQIENSAAEYQLQIEVENGYTRVNATPSKANQLNASKLRLFLQKYNQGNPYHYRAIRIAENILKNAREPNAGYTPVNLDHSARKFCDQVAEELTKVDFIALGDFEAKGLNQYLGKRVFMRLFVSKSHQICAAAFEIKPPMLSFLGWMKFIILGKWKTVRYVELQSETVEGVFKITNNSGESSPFDAGNHIKIKNLAVNSSVYDIVLEHKIRLQKHSQRSYKLIPDLKEFLKFQERIRLAKNTYRESVGYVTDDELMQLLGNKFDRFSSDIKSYLEKISEQTCELNYASRQREPVTEQTG